MREPLHDGDASGGRFIEPSQSEVERDMAIHDAVEAIIRLFRTIETENAHWIATSAIIAGEREAKGALWS